MHVVQAIEDTVPAAGDLPRRCTFDPGDWRILASHWYPVALVRDVDENGLVAAQLLDEPLVVYRADDEIVVAPDICPHRGVPLSRGANTDHRGIVCAYHGLQFGSAGRCIRVPAHPDNAIPRRLHLKAYPAIERYGLVWTCLRPGDGVPSIAEMPHWADTGFQQIVCPWIDIYGFAGRQLEGFLDVAHFGFVHVDTFGDPNNILVPAYDTNPTAVGFEAKYRSTVSNYPNAITKPTPAGFEWLRHFCVHLPFVATLEVHYPGSDRLVIMNAASPVSARVTRLFAPIARNFDTALPIDDVYAFNRRVFEEDKAIVESQMPENLPLEPVLEAHIPADRSSITYRRGLKQLGLSHFFTA